MVNPFKIKLENSHTFQGDGTVLLVIHLTGTKQKRTVQSTNAQILHKKRNSNRNQKVQKITVKTNVNIIIAWIWS